MQKLLNVKIYFYETKFTQLKFKILIFITLSRFYKIDCVHALVAYLCLSEENSVIYFEAT